MKYSFVVLGYLFCVLSMGFLIRGCVVSNYEYEKKYSYAWELADKSSTLEEKSKYINEFVSALEQNRNEFTDYNAVYLQTPDNSFDKNLQALKTLRDRLEQIKLMNPNSFEYQVAIQQITAQEQGEASQMLHVFKQCYIKQGYWYLWNWWGFLVVTVWIILLIATIWYNIYINENY